MEQCAKHCASCATQCIAATSGSATTNKNPQSHHQLVEQCKLVADLIPKVVQGKSEAPLRHVRCYVGFDSIEGIRGCMVKPDSFSSQANLLNACDDFIGPATRLASLAKASVPTVHDQSQALHLNNSSKQLTHALIDLRTCLSRVRARGFWPHGEWTRDFVPRLKSCVAHYRWISNRLSNRLTCSTKNWRKSNGKRSLDIYERNRKKRYVYCVEIHRKVSRASLP